MKIIRVQLPKDRLLALPEAERTFFIALGHIANELNAITRAAYWASNTPGKENSAQADGRFAMSLLFMRLLAGHLNEAWQLLQRDFFSGPALSKTYEPMLTGEAASALKSIKQYFKGQNWVFRIRNAFAFHYSSAEIGAVFAAVDDPLLIYMDPEARPNNLFYLSEVVLAHTLLVSLGIEHDKDAFGKLVAELFEVADWFAQVSYGVINAIFDNRAPELRAAAPEDVEFDDLQIFDKLYLPWFTDTSAAVERVHRIP